MAGDHRSHARHCPRTNHASLVHRYVEAKVGTTPNGAGSTHHRTTYCDAIFEGAVVSNIRRVHDVTIVTNGGADDDPTVDEIADCIISFADGAVASLSASWQGQRKIREIKITTDTHLFEIDLLRVNVTVYRNVMQDVIQSGSATSYRAETIVDMPFVRHQGEPLAQQINHFRRLIVGDLDATSERNSLLASHVLADQVLRGS